MEPFVGNKSWEGMAQQILPPTNPTKQREKILKGASPPAKQLHKSLLINPGKGWVPPPTFPVQGSPSRLQHVLECGMEQAGPSWGGGAEAMTCCKSQCGLMNPSPSMQDLDVSTLHRTELEVKLKGLQELMELKKTIYEQVGNVDFGDRSWISTHMGAWPGCDSRSWLRLGLRS